MPGLQSQRGMIDTGQAASTHTDKCLSAQIGSVVGILWPVLH